MIKLETNDGKVFNLEMGVVKQFGVINTLVNDLNVMADDIIPIPAIDSETMDKILDWAYYHKGEPEPTDADMKAMWYKQFMQLDSAKLSQLIMAANYLDIKCLLRITTIAVARMMKDKGIGQLGAMFKINYDIAEGSEACPRSLMAGIPADKKIWNQVVVEEDKKRLKQEEIKKKRRKQRLAHEKKRDRYPFWKMT